jgi:hypothetical protein
MTQQTARGEMTARTARPALIEGLITTKAKMMEALEKYLEQKANGQHRAIQRRITVNKKQIIRIAQIGVAAAAALTLTGGAEAAGNRSSKIIVERPEQLPELAQVPGEAMLLHTTNDGRTFLYIEQNEGARLATFDVTDPANIKEGSAVPLEAHGSFDFVSPLGDYAELVRYRDGQGEAVLNLHKAKVPTLSAAEGLKDQGFTERLGDDVLLVSDRPNVPSVAVDPDEEIIDMSNPIKPHTVADLRRVLEEITNDETGTTFVLTQDGLCVIRRPAVEQENFIHDWQMSHPG